MHSLHKVHKITRYWEVHPSACMFHFGNLSSKFKFLSNG